IAGLVERSNGRRNPTEYEKRLAAAAARHNVATIARYRRRRSLPLHLRCQRSCLARAQVGARQAVLFARNLPGCELYRCAGGSEMGVRPETRIPPGVAA